MGRVDGYSSMVQEGKPQVHNPQPQPTEQLTQVHPPVDVVCEPQTQQGIHQERTSGINVFSPQIIIPPIQTQVVYVQPPPPPAAALHPIHIPQQTQGFPPPPPPVVQCPPQPTYLQYPQDWTTGLFDCMNDPENAIITFFCPCVTFGQVAEIIDNGRTSCETGGMIYTAIALCLAMPCIYSFTYRTKLRSRFGLTESPAPDCMTHFCCEYCALCQEYRELNHRGLNPSAGWMNVGNQSMHHQRQQVMAPPQYQMMS